MFPARDLIPSCPGWVSWSSDKNGDLRAAGNISLSSLINNPSFTWMSLVKGLQVSSESVQLSAFFYCLLHVLENFVLVCHKSN